MTTAQMNVPADVAGSVPDVGGASNEPVRTGLPSGTERSEEAGVWQVPATVVAAILLALTLRAVVPDLRYEIAVLGLGVLLVGSVVALLLARRD